MVMVVGQHLRAFPQRKYFLSSMGSNDGVELTTTRRRIAESEALVAFLYKKIEVLETENIALRRSLGIPEKDTTHEYSENINLLECNTEERPKAFFISESKPDVLTSEREEVQEVETDHLMSFALDIFPVIEQRKGNIFQYSCRHVALKIMYQGERFHGFASESCSQRTVESELFTALEKTKLMVGGRVVAKYTRCGRTDKGVSANGQVVALYLRSSCKGPDPVTSISTTTEDRVAAAIASRTQEAEFAKMHCDGEIDYVGVLNRSLPSDIRVLGWCYVPNNFHARFSCLSREYNYFFVNDGLDIEAMRIAAGKLKGEHDFRNFCKMDADNVHNFRREILLFDIIPCADRWNGFDVCLFQVKGTAFLWHQVRCMVAILFMIGQRKESPSVIDELLDVSRTTGKPQYVMAPETCLVLNSCQFNGLSFYCASSSVSSLRSHWENMFRERLLAVTMLKNSYDQLPGSDGTRVVEATSRKIPHVNLLSRPTEPTYAERRMKFLSKKQVKP